MLVTCTLSYSCKLGVIEMFFFIKQVFSNEIKTRKKQRHEIIIDGWDTKHITFGHKIVLVNLQE